MNGPANTNSIVIFSFQKYSNKIITEGIVQVEESDVDVPNIQRSNLCLIYLIKITILDLPKPVTDPYSWVLHKTLLTKDGIKCGSWSAGKKGREWRFMNEWVKVLDESRILFPCGDPFTRGDAVSGLQQEDGKIANIWHFSVTLS